jgi:hypothetical protein
VRVEQRFRAFGVALVMAQRAELLKGVGLSCPKRSVSGVGRRFWAFALVLGLVLGAALLVGFCNRDDLGSFCSR